MRFIYPALLERVGEDEIVVSFRDLPECRTSGVNVAEALAEAQDALAEAIAGRIDDDEVVPEPSTQDDGEYSVVVPTEIAAKAALTLACRKSGQAPDALASSLGIDEQALRQMLDPRQDTDTDSINRALRILGSELVLEVRTLAPVSGE